MQLEPVRAAPLSAPEALHPDWVADDHLMSLLGRNARDHGSDVALRERNHGIWQEYTWKDYHDAVLAFAAGLEAEGVGQGDIVLVIGDNRPNLYFGMLGAVALRAIPSPAYADAPAEELAQQMKREGVHVAIAEDQEQVDKLLAARETHPGLRLIIYDDPRGLKGKEAPGVVAFSEISERGRARLAAEPGLAEDLLSRPSVHDVAILLHSSGTTGAPKGIPLKHGHVLAGVRNAAAAGYFQQGEVHMAYLPMAWVGDFIFSVGAAMALRFTVHVPEGQETALHDLREIAPTLYFAAPRAWSAMLTRIQVGVAETAGMKRRLYDAFVPFAVELERKRLSGHVPTATERLRRAMGEVLIYGPIRDHLGLSRVKRAYTAGEAIGEDVFLYFRALGLNLRQFYGQTENCALAVAQKPEDISLTTVGRPFPGVEMRIAEDGEILLRGDNIFDGYFQNDKSTAETLRDGWLHTGDAGQVEGDGQLVVLGRVSEVMHTASGTRYIPTYIENRLKFSPFIKDACVIGAGRDFLSAIICIDFAAVGQWAQENRVAYTSYAELSQRPEVYGLIGDVVAQVNAAMPANLNISRFVNLHKEFDPDDGEVTRTRKLRRNLIDDRYAAIIDAIYAGQDSVDYRAQITYENGQTGTIERRLSIRDVNGGEGR
ncbi:long-chain fatty acid--CoA ligase [Haematobacter missouriensis]|uniref:Long-chain fatty acid--CoA ligase n=1 Tax=Haematobacter missouriensis TaxID=366616 RepID=A0A212AX25_9RHOB|nr:AMP-binding protein [Haematobacter missouriensis]KFI34049.1 long-chain fatty acid--CoA ligase [Haematobacter missouriensis]OWJ78287.1 long-chain fatty acid--CoA ligase [Haematobacter missouriensis]OWJ86037.1 long-chain fatty acid--CoA ligase [Haematobacter missouriensis]